MLALHFGRRSCEPEVLDVEQADAGACRRDPGWIHCWTGAYRVTLLWLAQSCREKRPELALLTTTIHWRLPFRFAIGRIKH